MGSALMILVGGFQGDAEVMIDRRRDVSRGDGPLCDFTAVLGRGSNDLAVSEAPAGHQH